ncbi:hypothetical protein B9G55_14225 [Saccharibacillus sp. O16]|nr:hypothetical protein B9G55_14225 [Saccharibacillus sp. O16]
MGEENEMGVTEAQKGRQQIRHISNANQQKVAIVTGTSSGFGLHICLELARSGVRVAAGMRRPEAAEQLFRAAAEADQTAADRQATQAADFRQGESHGREPHQGEAYQEEAYQAQQPAYSGDLTALGKGPISSFIYPITLDVCDDARVTQAVEEIAARLGRIDILVNNAGLAMGGFVGDIPMQAWREQFAVNVFGMIAMTGAVLPYMREARSGCILQMSSVSGAIGLPGYGPYVSSKFAVEGFSESLALETAPYGIRTYVIQPASYKTDIWEKGFSGIHRTENSPNEAALNRMLEMSRASAEGGGDPRDVARLVVNLALGRRGKGRFRYVIPRGAALLVAMKKRLPFRLVQKVMLGILQRGMK